MKKIIYCRIRLQILARFSRYLMQHNVYPSSPIPIQYLLEVLCCCCTIRYLDEVISFYFSKSLQLPHAKVPILKRRYCDSFIQQQCRDAIYVFTIQDHSGHCDESKSEVNNSTNVEKFGPQLPSQLNCEIAVQKYGPLPPTTLESYSPSVATSDTSKLQCNSQKYGPPQLTDITEPSSEKTTSTSTNSAKFGPSLPVGFFTETESAFTDNVDDVPPLPDNCHTTIDRLLSLYSLDTDPPLDEYTNLQQVFGGNSHGFDPEDKEASPEEIGDHNNTNVVIEKDQTKGDETIKDNHFKKRNNSDEYSRTEEPFSKEKKPPNTSPKIDEMKKQVSDSKDIPKEKHPNISNNFGLGKFELPKFSSFPTSEIDNVIRGKKQICNSTETYKDSRHSRKRKSSYYESGSNVNNSKDSVHKDVSTPLKQDFSNDYSINKIYDKGSKCKKPLSETHLGDVVDLTNCPLMQGLSRIDHRMPTQPPAGPIMPMNAPFDPRFPHQNPMMPINHPFDPRFPQQNPMMPMNHPFDPRFPQQNPMMPMNHPFDQSFPQQNPIMPMHHPFDPRSPMNNQPNPFMHRPPPRFDPRMAINPSFNNRHPLNVPFNQRLPMPNHGNQMMHRHPSVDARMQTGPPFDPRMVINPLIMPINAPHDPRAPVYPPCHPKLPLNSQFNARPPNLPFRQRGP